MQLLTGLYVRIEAHNAPNPLNLRGVGGRYPNQCNYAYDRLSTYNTTGDTALNALLHSAARIAAGVFFGVFVVLSLIYMFQEKLIFFPQPLSREEADTIAKMYPYARV